MTTLVKLIPPLRQSSIPDLACDHAYVAKHVNGKRMPASLASDRGDQVHRIAAEYVRYCVDHRIAGDWAAFDRIAAQAGPDAASMVYGIRDNYTVDYDHVIGVEQTFYLDEHFQPCEAAATYSGTKDIELLLSETVGAVEDWKSHPAPWEPPDPQSDLYAIDSFQRNPELQQLIFIYRFVRYGKCFREYTYERADLPAMMERISVYRRRQLAIHKAYEAGTALHALPGSHCAYCPKLANISCPIAEFNPHATHSPEDRLRFAVWFAQLKAQNDEVLKAHVEATERPLTIRDGNGQEYSYAPWPSESVRFPLPMVNEKLLDWKDATGEDFAEKLYVGSTELKAKLKAKKRAVLDQAMRDSAEAITKTKWGIRDPRGTILEE